MCLEGSDGFVTSTAAPIATGRSNPVAGWELHPLKTNTFARRTLILSLLARLRSFSNLLRHSDRRPCRIVAYRSPLSAAILPLRPSFFRSCLLQSRCLEAASSSVRTQKPNMPRRAAMVNPSGENSVNRIGPERMGHPA